MDKRDLIQQEINGLLKSTVGKVTDKHLIAIDKKRHESERFYVYDANGNFIKECYGSKDVKKLTGLNPEKKGSLKWMIKTEYLGEKIEQRVKQLVGKKPKKVIQYTVDGQFVKEWESCKEAAKQLNIHSTGISMVLSGKRKTCIGFIWKYE